jgi:hypothetical protein
MDALHILASAAGASAVQPSLTSFRAGTEFRGTERLTVRRQLGAGGMGVVYEVHDQVRNEVVALKTLLRARAADIYRLKREFRSLANVAHPNLVSLYESVVDGADCFFTMELVHGVNLVQYVRGSPTTAPLPSQQRLVGTGRDVSRSDPRGAGRGWPPTPSAASTASWRGRPAAVSGCPESLGARGTEVRESYPAPGVT